MQFTGGFQNCHFLEVKQKNRGTLEVPKWRPKSDRGVPPKSPEVQIESAPMTMDELLLGLLFVGKYPFLVGFEREARRKTTILRGSLKKKTPPSTNP